jgi:hypothetical protein
MESFIEIYAEASPEALIDAFEKTVIDQGGEVGVGGIAVEVFTRSRCSGLRYEDVSRWAETARTAARSLRGESGVVETIPGLYDLTMLWEGFRDGTREFDLSNQSYRDQYAEPWRSLLPIRDDTRPAYDGSDVANVLEQRFGPQGPVLESRRYRYRRIEWSEDALAARLRQRRPTDGVIYWSNVRDVPDARGMPLRFDAGFKAIVNGDPSITLSPEGSLRFEDAFLSQLDDEDKASITLSPDGFRLAQQVRALRPLEVVRIAGLEIGVMRFPSYTGRNPRTNRPVPVPPKCVPMGNIVER